MPTSAWLQCSGEVNLFRLRPSWHDSKVCSAGRAEHDAAADDDAAATRQDEFADFIAAWAGSAVEVALNQHLCSALHQPALCQVDNNRKPKY